MGQKSIGLLPKTGGLASLKYGVDRYAKGNDWFLVNISILFML